MQLVERRIGLLFAFFLAMLALAVARELWLSTIKAGSLSQRADAQQAQTVKLPARRGTITDRRGVELAVSEDSVTVFANPRVIKNPVAESATLAAAMGVDQSQLLPKLSDRSRGFVYVARKLPLANGQAVERLKLPGIATTNEPRRVYPEGTLAAQLLGSVGTDNYGLSGLEQSLERRLHGTDGERRIVTDARGQPVSIVDDKRAGSGHDVRLTIDAAIQQRTESVLAGVGAAYSPRGATALVLDPRSGEILALANWPSVDPSRPGAAPAYASQDRAVESSYEPGSTFKPVTVSGALQDGVITPSTVFGLPPQLQVADRTISDAEPRGFESMTVGDILARSSNVGAVTIGMKLGAVRFDQWVRRFGFGASTGIDVPGEAAGIVPHPRQYSGSSMGNLPMGQGLAVTPMQMAAAYEAIAEHGVIHRPHVIASDPAPARRVISDRTASEVAKMLEGVLGPNGTAPEASVPGYTIAGKTGTAQKIDPATGTYSHTKYVASFIGFAPEHHPRLLVAVMVDEPQGQIYGGSVAAPAFEKIASFALSYMRIPPG